MTQVAQQAHADQDTAVPDRVEARIAELIAQDVVLTAREKAVARLKAPVREELLLLLKQKGVTRRRTLEGQARIGERTSYKVSDHEKLVDLFLPDVPEEHRAFWAEARASLAVLFEQIKVDKAFWKAAKEARIKIEQAVTPDAGSRFTVEPHKTAEAQERQERIIEETKQEMERRVEVLARRMMERNVRSES